jgi:hypothetical protein
MTDVSESCRRSTRSVRTVLPVTRTRSPDSEVRNARSGALGVVEKCDDGVVEKYDDGVVGGESPLAAHSFRFGILWLCVQPPCADANTLAVDVDGAVDATNTSFADEELVADDVGEGVSESDGLVTFSIESLSMLRFSPKTPPSSSSPPSAAAAAVISISISFASITVASLRAPLMTKRSF